MDKWQFEDYLKENINEILETYEAYWDKELNYSNLSTMKMHSERIRFLANYKKFEIDNVIVMLKSEMEDTNELQDN